MSIFIHPTTTLSQSLENLTSYGERSSFLVRGTCSIASRLISATAFPTFWTGLTASAWKTHKSYLLLAGAGIVLTGVAVGLIRQAYNSNSIAPLEEPFEVDPANFSASDQNLPLRISNSSFEPIQLGIQESSKQVSSFGAEGKSQPPSTVAHFNNIQEKPFGVCLANFSASDQNLPLRISNSSFEFIQQEIQESPKQISAFETKSKSEPSSIIAHFDNIQNEDRPLALFYKDPTPRFNFSTKRDSAALQFEKCFIIEPNHSRPDPAVDLGSKTPKLLMDTSKTQTSNTSIAFGSSVAIDMQDVIWRRAAKLTSEISIAPFRLVAKSALFSFACRCHSTMNHYSALPRQLLLGLAAVNIIHTGFFANPSPTLSVSSTIIKTAAAGFLIKLKHDGFLN